MIQKQKQVLSATRPSACSGKSKALSIFNRCLALVILVSGFFYVLSTNDLSIKGFVIERLKREIVRIENDNKLAELHIMEKESYENIDRRAKEMNMVKIDKIDYIKSVGADVAMR